MPAVRLFKPGEEPLLQSLYEACFDEPFDLPGFRALMASPGFWSALAWCGAPASHDAVGYAMARSVAGEAEIVSLGVRPDWRRRGVAAALLADTVLRAAALGAETVFLEVAEDNAPAISLYVSAGFEMAGRRQGYYRRKTSAPIAALIMRYIVKKSVS